MKKTYRKIRDYTKKAIKLIVIILVSFVFLYCVLCIIAKLLPDNTNTNTDVTRVTDVTEATDATDVIDTTATNTTTTTKTGNTPTFISALKSLLVLEDFANTALGAMFGFGASMILENFILIYTKKKALRNIVDEIIQIIIQLGDMRKKELALISGIPIVNGEIDKKDIEKYISKYTEEIPEIYRSLKCYKDVLYFPIWEAILQNGDLLYFRKENYFSSLIKVYTRLIKIKHMIDEPSVDENNIKDVIYYLLYLELNIKEFLTLGNDFEDSLLNAIDSINQQEENLDYKCYFEVEK